MNYEPKAVHLAITGSVEVDLYQMDADGMIETAAGHVTSGDNTYWTTIDPDGGSCTCNEYQDGRTHSHTLALRLAAQQEARTR